MIVTVTEARTVLHGIIRQAQALEEAFLRSAIEVTCSSYSDDNKAILMSAVERGVFQVAVTQRKMSQTLANLTGRCAEEDMDMEPLAMLNDWRNTSLSAMMELHLIGHDKGHA